MALQYEIQGTTLPVVTIQLQPGERIYSSAGGMSWMSDPVIMDTNTGGGLGRMVRRAFSGESLFIVDYFTRDQVGEVAFAAEFPGKIVDVELPEGRSVIVQKDAFMCAEKSVDLDIHFRRSLGTGLFGGEGFILQRLTGPGRVFVNFDGEIVQKTLGPGERLRVDTGHVAMFEPTVNFNVEMMRGFKNILLGGEGLFLATLTGPGRVWLQTMPMAKLALRIAQYIPRPGGSDGPSGGLNVNMNQLLGGQ
ncbi:MAG: TIGR00266 family protein [Caldilineaceae bacterium]|nr:TIGR00266 family protein [Caldilineaceae bacterium]